VADEFEDVGAVLSPENAELVLKANHVHLAHVEEVCGHSVVGEGSLVDLEPHLGGVAVPLGYVVHHHGPAFPFRVLLGQGRQKVRGERRDPALAGKIVPYENDLARHGPTGREMTHIDWPPFGSEPDPSGAGTLEPRETVEKAAWCSLIGGTLCGYRAHRPGNSR